jgi:hypothetical protein
MPAMGPGRSLWLCLFDDGRRADFSYRNSVTWDELRGSLPDWIAEIEYNISTPDFWEELKASREAITAVDAADTGNAPFTQAEQDQITAAFASSKLIARERYSLTEEQFASIERKLDEMVETSRTMGRKDWINLVGSAGFSLIVGSLFTPEVVQHVLGTAFRGIAHIFGLDFPPLTLT